MLCVESVVLNVSCIRIHQILVVAEPTEADCKEPGSAALPGRVNKGDDHPVDVTVVGQLPEVVA